MKNSNKYTYVCCFLFSALVNLTGQENKTGNWFIYLGNQKINTRWNWFNEVQYRNYNFIGDLEQLLLRTAIGYGFPGSSGNISLGYAYIVSENYVNITEKNRIQEHRPFQQFISRQQYKRINIQHRYRLEERFLPDDFRIRFRYFLASQIPINKPALEKNAIYLSLYNEIFIHTDKSVFDRNRIFGAVGYVFNKNFRLELGWMNQLLENRWRAQWQFVFYNNLSFSN